MVVCNVYQSWHDNLIHTSQVHNSYFIPVEQRFVLQLRPPSKRVVTPRRCEKFKTEKLLHTLRALSQFLFFSVRRHA